MRTSRCSVTIRRGSDIGRTWSVRAPQPRHRSAADTPPRSGRACASRNGWSAAAQPPDRPDPPRHVHLSPPSFEGGDERIRAVRHRDSLAQRPRQRGEHSAEGRDVRFRVLQHRGVDPRHVRAADVDAPCRHLGAQRVGEVLDAGLARVVRRQARGCDERRQRRHDQDVSAGARAPTGSAARTVWNTPSRFTSTTRSKSSGSTARTLP